MNYWVGLILLMMVACNNERKEDKHNSSVDSSVATGPITAEVRNKNGGEICWMGMLEGKTPVFIHYRLDSGLVVGAITYLNTKNRSPITLLGTIESDSSYRLLEFEESGNITGIITGAPSRTAFEGTWFSPKTRKELGLKLTTKDTAVASAKTDVPLQEVFGHYHYQYGKDSYQGDLDISSLPNAKASFGISSVTSAPAYNIAQIDNDTIALTKPQFNYTVPSTDSCAFEVKFYNGFAYIHYTKGTCDGQFGMNATVEGIFIKTK